MNGSSGSRANGRHEVDAQQRAKMREDAATAVAALLDALRIDWRNDHNTEGTPQRVARMYVDEVMAGRYEAPPDLTDFPNVRNLDQVYVVGPCDVRSMCSHHLVPIIGKAWVAVLPSDRVIGLSKFSRLLRWVMSRPQIQEEATVQVADAIEEAIAPLGLMVVVKAQHMCMVWRGVKESGTSMVTSVVRGVFRDAAGLREEAMRLIELTTEARR